jgi:peptidoglycan biosynthesis protein MviN/MurJ (putative lipid II flippase)
MILAAGHYKQTQHIFIIAAALNMSVSVILVLFYGLVGVAIGTIVGMLYQTLHMQYYCITKLKVYSYKHFIKVFAIDLITIGLVFVSTRNITLSDQKWLAWILMACKVCVVCFLEELAVCLVFERKLVKSLFHLLLRKFRRE